jgi:polysaccharide pyruvyl transferase WcaK-like protein
MLIGNYGVGNFGDEALKEYFVRTFPECEWYIVSAHPTGTQEVPRLPTGLRSFFAMGWVRTLKELQRTDAVVFGGGSLFTDSESVFACFLWWIHAAVAALFGKPRFFAFQGIGPFRTKLGEWFCKRAFKNATFVSVRDEQSFARIQPILNTKVIQSFDPIYSAFCKEKVDDISKNVFTVIPRHNSSASFIQRAVDMVNSHKFSSVVILSFQPDDVQEQKIVDEIQKQMPVPTRVVSAKAVADVMKAVGEASSVLTERYHGALAAMSAGKATVIVAQREGDKLDSLQKKKIDWQKALRLVEIGEEELRKSIRTIEKSNL